MRDGDARVIGIDVGTSSAKGVAIDERGAVLAEAEHPIPISHAAPRLVRAGPRGLVGGHRGGPGPARRRRGRRDRPARVRCTGSSCSAPTRRPLRPAILWNDGRSQPQATRIEEELGIERLVALSGNRVLAGFTAPKLTWLAENEPDVHRQIERVLLPKDYVRFRLTGELATDVSDASGTVLLDVGRRAWSPELAEAFAVDPSWLPAGARVRGGHGPHRHRRAGGRGRR